MLLFWGRLRDRFETSRWPDALPVSGPRLTQLPCTGSAAAPVDTPFAVSVDPIALREDLLTGLTGAVDSAIAEYTNPLPCDIHAEWNLIAVYDAFRVTDTSLLAALNGWVAYEPKAPGPRIARAAYYTEAAWRARGTRFVRDTPSAQLLAMARNFHLAAMDLREALRLDPRALAAYYLIIDRTQALGERALGHAALERGLEAWPLSVQLRRAYIRGLVPRWGGGYDAMAAVARQADSSAGLNPELHVLGGYVAWERGRTVRENGDTAGSVALFNEAVRYGAYPPFLVERGESLAELGRLDAAAADFDRALALWPGYVEGYRERAIGLATFAERLPGATRVSLEARALSDLRFAARLSPGDRQTEEWITYLSH